MNSDTAADEDLQRSAGQPAQQNGPSNDAPVKPAFKMPEPPKKKVMAPPPPRFSATLQQTSTPSLEQASAPGSIPDVVNAKTHGTSERLAEPSSDALENEEGEASALLQSPATAKGLPSPVTRTVDKARMAGIAAAAAAAAHVTPAQREKAVADAAAAAYAASQAEKEKANSAPAAASSDAGPPRDPSTYAPPDWAGPPTGLDYTLEVMKNGQIVETREVSSSDSFTFGRTPGSDFVLEHPSASRLHAVLQYRGADGQAFLFDAGSAHGTFLNKQQIPSRTHVPLRVGDMFKFGRSTRMYILGGPTELMPEEGLTKKQMLTMKALEAKEARKEREAQVAKAQMEAALHSGVSWGMAGDDQAPEDEDEAAALSVDWRAYSQTHTLTDKQAKLAEKIRKRENRIGALQKEVDKIRAKQKAMEELTQGQAMTLVRNEQVIDRSAEEAEDLEEMLNESIADSLRGAKQKAAGQKEEKKKKRKKRNLEEEEAEGVSSGEDEFYDRTMDTKKKRSKAAAHVEDAASLYGRKEALLEERRRLEAAIQKELKGKGAAVDAAAGPAASQAAAAADSSHRDAAAAADGQEDALDAFMNDVQHQIEEDKVATLQKEMADIDKQVADAERMLKFADPDGYYREGTHAAEMAKTKGIRALKIEKQRQEAEAKQRKEVQGRKQQEAAFVPEEEEEDPQSRPLAGILPEQPGQATQSGAQAISQQQDLLQTNPRSRGVASADPQAVGSSSARVEAPGDRSESAAAAAPAEAAAVPSILPKQVVQDNPHRLAAEDPQQGGLQLMKKPGQLLTREQLKAQKAAKVTKAKANKAASAGGAHAASGLLADLALLQGADRMGSQAGAGDGAEQWKPPEDQKGDGRTKLNDLLGY